MKNTKEKTCERKSKKELTLLPELGAEYNEFFESLNEAEPALSKKDLAEIWREKYRFNKSKLLLDEKKAQEWATRAARAIIQAELQLQGKK